MSRETLHDLVDRIPEEELAGAVRFLEYLAVSAAYRAALMAPAADDEYAPAQRRIVDARLAKADQDIKAGRVYGPFDTAEEMAASIEENIIGDITPHPR